MVEERIDWPDGAKLALSLVVNVEEGSEQSVSRGDKGMEPIDVSPGTDLSAWLLAPHA